MDHHPVHAVKGKPELFGCCSLSTAIGVEPRECRGGFADVSPSGLTLLAEQAVDLKDFDMADLEQQITNAKEDVADAEVEKKVAAEEALALLEEARNAVQMATGGSQH